jgi:aminopeptidase N
VLHLLRDKVVGPEAFDAAFQEYIRRWAFKHPTPADFFRTMQDVTGRDLDWFWRQWIYTTETLDQAVTDVTQARNDNGSYNAAVTLVSNSSVLMPVDLRLTLANGETRNIALPVEIWYGGRSYTFPMELPAAVTGVAIDPANDLPDQNRSNNVWGIARR